MRCSGYVARMATWPNLILSYRFLSMRWDIKVTVYLSFAAAFLAILVMVAPDVLSLSDGAKTVAFWVGLTGAIVFGTAGFRAAIVGERQALLKGHKRRMVGLYGMIICVVGLIGFASVYFWPEKSAQPHSLTLGTPFPGGSCRVPGW